MVVPLIDDFSDGELDNPFWHQARDTGNAWTVSDQSAFNNSTNGTQNAIRDLNMHSSGVFVSRQKGFISNSSGLELGFSFNRTGTGFSDPPGIIVFNKPVNSTVYLGGGYACTFGVPTNRFFDQTITRGPDQNLRIYIDGNLVCSTHRAMAYTGRFFAFSHAGNGLGRVDSIFLYAGDPNVFTVHFDGLESSEVSPEPPSTLRFFFPLENTPFASISFDAHRSIYGDIIRLLPQSQRLLGLDENRLLGVAQLSDCPKRRTAFVSTSFDAFSPNQQPALLDALLRLLDQNVREPCEPPKWRDKK